MNIADYVGEKVGKLPRVDVGQKPRVTAILKGAGLIDTSWFTPEMAERGTAVHLACQQLDEGTLNEKVLDDAVRPRLVAYKKFLKELNPRIVAIEQYVEHKELRYCGHLDRIVEMGGYGGILDIKGPAKAAWHGLQTEAYRRCVDWTPKRWTLHLSDSGYLLIEHMATGDWAAFHAALVLHNWRASNGS